MVSISEPIAVWRLPSAKKDVARPIWQPRVSPALTSNNRQNSRLFLGTLVVAGIGFTGFLLFRRASKPKTSSPQPTEQKQISAPNQEGMLHYKNKETRAIEWNEDGLPIRITIEREYYRLP